MKAFFSSGKIQTIVWISLLALAFCCGRKPSYEFADLYEGLPFDMPRVQRPSIPKRSASIVEFGAVGDGITLNTEAFAAAISHVCGKGGGHVVVPEGIWLTGPVTLLDNIDLHLEEGAVIVFSADRDLYPIIETNFEGLDM